MARSRLAAVPDDDLFEMRLRRSADDLWPMLEAIYAGNPAWQDFRSDLLSALRRGWRDRPAALKRRDLQRDLEPDWFLRPDMAGYVFYIDRFAGTLKGVLDRLDYLEDLGVSEVARVLDVPAGTVKSRLHHARNEFKELWQQATK